MLPLQTGGCVAEDVHLPFMIAFQYHGIGVLASNKKTVLTHRFHPVSPEGKEKGLGNSTLKPLLELLDKIIMKNYST